MKTRIGFISNSSTSSFVVVGFRVTEEESDSFENSLQPDSDGNLQDAYDYLYDNNFTVLHGSDDGISDDSVVWGIEIADGDECGLENKEFKIDELKKQPKLKELMEQMGIDRELILFMGTRAC